MKKLFAILLSLMPLPTFAIGELGAWDDLKGHSSSFPLGSILVVIIIILVLFFAASSNKK